MAAPTSLRTEPLTLVVVGHVDHGKSTLLGRLYADTGALPEGKIEKVQAICAQQGKEFEYAFLFDAFLEEQHQGITIDMARTFFTWHERQYTIVDAPGHQEFLKNMVTGASRADAALVVIDAQEGVKEQSRRHGQLLSLLGVRQLMVLVNKMDLIGYDQAIFDSISREYRAFLGELGLVPRYVIPVSAKLGDNVAQRSNVMDWYQGPTVLDSLEDCEAAAPGEALPLRFPVQGVYKFDARRIIAGRIATGRLQVGDRLLFSPLGKVGTIKTIEEFNTLEQPTEAGAGQSIGVTLEEQIFVERGAIASHEKSAPGVSADVHATLFWLGAHSLQKGRSYTLRLATQEMPCEVKAIHRVVDVADLVPHPSATVVAQNEVAELTLRTKRPIAFDSGHEFPITGRFVLVDGHDIAGGGVITPTAYSA
jgi:bifunctional enzyme CysN/CysC